MLRVYRITKWALLYFVSWKKEYKLEVDHYYYMKQFKK